MSFSATMNVTSDVPVSILEYPDLGELGARPRAGSKPSISEDAEAEQEERAALAEEQVAQRIRQEREDASHKMEQQLRQQHDAELQTMRISVASEVASFQVQRAEYFARVESEVVQLALSIAAKILHREAQMDPMLVTTLVRVAIENMQQSSTTKVRVASGQGGKWKQAFSAPVGSTAVQVMEDRSLAPLDVIVETELGTANFGFDSQLKEIERGICDLIALRPTSV
jgi:flagellar assembly protein FliH